MSTATGPTIYSPHMPKAARGGLFAVFAATGFSALTLQVVWQRVISLHAGVDLLASTTVITAFLAGLGLGNLARRSGGRSLGRPAVAARVCRCEPADRALRLGEPVVALRPLSIGRRAASTRRSRCSPSTSSLLVGADDADGCLAAAAFERRGGGGERDRTGGRPSLRDQHARRRGRRDRRRLVAPGNVRLRRHGARRRHAQPAGGSRGVARCGGAAGRDEAASTPPEPIGRPREVRASRPPAPALAGSLRLSPAPSRSGSRSSTSASSTRFCATTPTPSPRCWRCTCCSSPPAPPRARAGSRVGGSTRPELWFLCLQFLVGATSLAGMLGPPPPAAIGGIAAFVERYFTTDGFMEGLRLLERRGRGAASLYAHVVAPLLVMGAPVLLMGASFPFIQARGRARLDSLGRRTGALLFANICGNVTGGAITGFLLLDRLGTPGTLRCCRRACWRFPASAPPARLPHALARRAGAVGSRRGLSDSARSRYPSNERFWAFFHSTPLDRFELDEDRACVTSLVDVGDETFLYINGELAERPSLRLVPHPDRPAAHAAAREPRARPRGRARHRLDRLLAGAGSAPRARRLRRDLRRREATDRDSSAERGSRTSRRLVEDPRVQPDRRRRPPLPPRAAASPTT